MKTIVMITETMVPSTGTVKLEKEAEEFTKANYRPDFHVCTFLVSMGTTQQVGFIKQSNFFHYQRTDDNEKVLLASFHLQDDALEWYQWYEQSQPNVTWEKFT